jgi:phospholipid/cholesterol/gamma-HCH transport system ATP-binding protein
MPSASERSALVEVQELTMAYGGHVLQRDLSFTIERGDTFVIMGGSGSGKSTLMRHLVGLNLPARGQVLYGGESLFESDPTRQEAIRRRVGVMYQQGALWSSMTLLENVALPLARHTGLERGTIEDLAMLKLALVGLGDSVDRYPAEISGGMRKRAAIARALALDPEILFLDEPSAGLDPISSRHLDDLIVELGTSLGMTVVIVTHELASILAIGTDSVFLDAASRTMIATGHPRRLLEESEDPRVLRFLTRGAAGAETGP